MYNLYGKTNIEYIPKIEPIIWRLIKKKKMLAGNIVTSDSDITVNLKWKKGMRSFYDKDARRLFYRLINIERNS